MNPDMDKVHHEEADGPTECITVMAQDWKSLMWETLANVPSYGRVAAVGRPPLGVRAPQARAADPAVRRGAGRWALKSPHHAIALDELSDVYPDATFVSCTAIPSWWRRRVAASSAC